MESRLNKIIKLDSQINLILKGEIKNKEKTVKKKIQVKLGEPTTSITRTWYQDNYIEEKVKKQILIFNKPSDYRWN